ncbi:unnamed protein product [Pedinophyceae sp. YPF-701]|nr:unnamed protein product [Pedinophyceae sp. YPF-701]
MAAAMYGEQPYGDTYGAGQATGTSPAKPNRDKKTCKSITVKQLLEAHSDGNNYFVDNDPLATVSLVGRVVDVNASDLGHVVMIDDTTGVCPVEITDDGDAEKMRGVEVNKYVRVFGGVKSSGGSVAINCMHVRPVEDHNEITHFILEAIFTHIHFTKGTRGDGANAAGAAIAGAAYGAGYGAAGGAGYGAAGGAAGGLVDSVMQVLDSPAVHTRDSGVQLDELVRMLGAGVTREQVQAACDALLQDGRVYTTIDQYHFRSCTM